MIVRVLFLITIASLFSQSSLAEKSAIAKRFIDFEFEPTEGASSYELEITKVVGSTKKKPVAFKTKKPEWKGNVSPGTYELKLRSIDARGVAGEWGEVIAIKIGLPTVNLVSPADKAVLKNSSDEKLKVKFAWKDIPGAKEYRLNFQKVGEEKFEIVKTESTESEVELAAGEKYKWFVIADSEEGTESDAPENPFTFAVEAAPLSLPTVEINPTPEDAKMVRWDAPKAKTYNYKVMFNSKKRGWRALALKKNVDTKEFVIPEKWPSGTYRIEVSGDAPGMAASPTQTAEFKIAKRAPASISQSKAKLPEPFPNFYGIASYLVTIMSYTGEVYDDQTTAITYNAIGGTGRLGLGYKKSENIMGYRGLLDLSGFTVAGKIVTFASSELETNFAFALAGGTLNASLGAFYKELPVTIGEGDTTTSTKKASFMGPQASLGYSRSITNKLGLSFEFRPYYGVAKVTTPNGRDIVPSLSYQAQLLGSYRLGNRSIGYAGYTFRKDSVKYLSLPSSGTAQESSRNTVEITGHYINLILNWGF